MKRKILKNPPTHTICDLAFSLHALILTVYLIIGTFLEERKLVYEFGDQYRNYQKQVSMLLPLKWLNLKFRKVLSN